jgi:hypothetical protein
VRPNIGTVAGGSWVWDHTASLPWEVLYSANYSALELPTEQELTDILLLLAQAERLVERDPVAGWISRIELRATDAEGRTLAAVGEPVSRIIIHRHTCIDINSLVRWDISGALAWGEDQDMWPVHRWARMRRAQQNIKRV